MGKCSIENVISILNIPTRSGGKRLSCPICKAEGGAGKDAIGIVPDGNYFKCFRCGASGNGIHLYGLFKYGYAKDYIEGNQALKDALIKEICRNGKGSGLSYNDQAFKKNEYKRVDVDPICLTERDRTYSKMLQMLDLTDEHRNNLRKRGLRDSDIDNNGYKSVPKLGYTKIPKDLRKEACDLLGVPGFFKKNDVWSLTKTKQGFYIPARSIAENGNRYGMIQGLQIRFDTVTADDIRYKWLSTRDMVSGCAAETYTHFVGRPSHTILLTEGPLKADIIYRFLEVPIIAVPGVNSTSKLAELLPTLWQMGVRVIKTAFDMDYLHNINVVESYVKLVKMLREKGFVVERLLWDEEYKGLDDWLLNVYYHKGGKLSTDKNPEAL